MEMKVTDLTGLGDGILMPQSKNRFRLTFTGNKSLFPDDAIHIMTLQTISCSYDYHLKVLNVILEQDRYSSKLHDLVKQFSALSKNTANADNISFVVEMLNTDDTVLHAFKFEGCSLIRHLFELDYAANAAAQHELKFSFKSLKEI